MSAHDPTQPDGPESSTATLEVDQHSREELLKLADDMAFIEPLRLPRPRQVDVDEAPPAGVRGRGAGSSTATESVDDAVREQLLQFAEELELEQEP